eukprot:gene24011-10121_t
MKEEAEQEKKVAEASVVALMSSVTMESIPQDSHREKFGEVMVEVEGGVGGAEGALFAGELLDAYALVAEKRGWDFAFDEDGEDEDDNNINLTENCHRAKVSGNGVVSFFDYERGVHKVQRVPVTEKGSRTHSSTCSVSAISLQQSFRVAMPDSDLRITSTKSGGPGGQSVNKTMSQAVILS